MTSKLEDTKVDDLDVANLSDEDLADIANNDSRIGAREKAQAEIDRRDADDDTPDAAPEREGKTALEAADDVSYTDEGHPQVAVRDSAGREVEAPAEDLGAGQVQAKVDAATIAGVTTGETDPSKVNPPSRAQTVSGVTGNTALQDLADEG